MPLIVYVSRDWIQIPKFKIKSPFTTPPEKISKPTFETLKILKQSICLLEDSTRKEKEEVFQLFKAYGYHLYQNIFPFEIRSLLSKERDFYIYSLDEESHIIPFELLHDSNSFLALSHGITRIMKGNYYLKNEAAYYPLLNIALTSSTPTFNSKLDNFNLYDNKFSDRFIVNIEDQIIGDIADSTPINFNISPALHSIDLDNILKSNPHVLLFSGYGGDKYWILEQEKQSTPKSYFFKQFSSNIQSATENGLKLLILITSAQLEDSQERSYSQIKSFFSMGLLFIININGRVGRKRIQKYTQNLFLQLSRGKSILSSHRYSLNQLASSLSWDWNWIQLRINSSLIENENFEDLSFFKLKYENNTSSKQNPAFLSSRRFRGNTDTLSSVIYELSNNNTQKVICLYNSNKLEVETYLREYLRRKIYKKDIIVKSLNYFPTFSESFQNNAEMHYHELLEKFSFLHDDYINQGFFEESLTSLSSPCREEEAAQKIIIVFSTSSNKNEYLDKWIAKKQSSGWLIIFTCSTINFTKKPTTILSISSIKKKSLLNLFENRIPEVWLNYLNKNDLVPQQMQNLTLLKMLVAFKNPELIEKVTQLKNANDIWIIAFNFFFENFSTDLTELFTTLFLIKSRCKKSLLKNINKNSNIEESIDALISFQILEVSIDSKEVWVPYFLNELIENLNLIPDHILFNRNENLISSIFTLFESSPSKKEIIQITLGAINFLILSNDSAQLILRCIQISRLYQRNNFGLTPLILTLNRIAIKFAIDTKEPEIIEETILNCLDIINKTGVQTNIIEVYEWFLIQPKERLNWKQISIIQNRLAKLYAESGEKEKAISLLTSVLNLNSDIQNYSERYNTMIRIALLLLENEQYEKVEDTLLSIQFEPNLLSKANIAKLWIIDGHLKNFNKETQLSLTSLVKGLENEELSISSLLSFRSFKIILDILNKNKMKEDYLIWSHKALSFFEKNNELVYSRSFHKELFTYFNEKSEISSALPHLVAMYNGLEFLEKNEEELKEIRKVSNLLGGLYFKLGEQEKSTEFYKKALKY